MDVPPTLDNFDVCATYYGAIGAGETKAFPCVKTGRYVIVQLNSYYDNATNPTTMILTLCDVKVFTGTVFPRIIPRGIISFQTASTLQSGLIFRCYTIMSLR